MHTEWKVSAPQQMSVYAIEVARRQPDVALADRRPLHGRQAGCLLILKMKSGRHERGTGKPNDTMKVITYINTHKALVIPVVFGPMWFYRGGRNHRDSRISGTSALL